MVNMVFVVFERPAFAFHFNPSDDVGHLAFVIKDGAFGGQEWNQASESEHVGAKVGFEICVGSEHHDGMKILCWQIKCMRLTVHV